MAADDVGPEVGAEPGEPATANGGGATANGGGSDRWRFAGAWGRGPAPQPPVPDPAPTARMASSSPTKPSSSSRPFELKVGLSPSSPPGVAGPPLELPKPEETAYNLDIQLFADGFDLGQGESWQQSLAVSTDDLYPTAVVHLIARPIPERRATRSITATFSIEGETLGAATRQLIVTADAGDVALIAPAPTTTGTNVTAPTGEPPADVTITITRGVERGVLQWGITSKLPGVALPHDRPAMSDVGQEPKAFATAIVREFFVHDNQVGVFQLLQGIGKTIAALIPQTVRTALETANAAVAPRPLDVLLLTEEAYVPWELAWIAHPFDKTAPPYLGAQANVGRWVLDGGATPTDPPRQVDAATMAVVWGVYHSASLPPLAAAEAEAKKIQKLYGASSIDARPDPVFGLLGGVPPADILHFAVHGRYDPLGAGDGIYLVEGPPIDPFQIRGSDLSSRAPFVFLNACQVGSGQELLGSYGGIAQAFLQVGASAVVAPLWSIDDEIAQHIALEFYHQALAPADAKVDGHPAGDATPAATDDTPAPVAEAGRAATTTDPLSRTSSVGHAPGSSRTRPPNRRRISPTSSTAIRRFGCRGTGSTPREDTTMADLDPSGQTIQLGELGLRTPRLTGTADAVDAMSGAGLRAAGGTSREFQAALDRAEMETTHVVEIQAAELPGAPGGHHGRAAGSEGAVELDVPQPPEGFEQAVLSVDEAGVTTWSFAPAPVRGHRRTRGATGTRTFTVRRTTGAPRAGRGSGPLDLR